MFEAIFEKKNLKLSGPFPLKFDQFDFPSYLKILQGPYFAKKINATTQTSQKKPKKAFLGTVLKILTMTKKLRFFGVRSATASQNKFY